ncbi:MAG: myxosortase-dependent phytase-like phosphatase [Hyalangium sp.]|uniref:myxosortase-dependent phytase-like phosphatase n=1 Tax=Hyalangium sp. TaxID=2028555 RepID=UPI0038999AD3
MRIPTALAVLVVLAGLPVAAQPVNVGPVAETQPVVRGGNAAQDVALWTNSGTPGQSLVIVADSAVGLITFRLDGSEWQALLSDGVAYGVDVHDGFSLPGGTAPLVVVANGTLQALTAYVVDPISLQLRRVDTGTLIVPSFAPRTVTLYRSAATGTFYAFISNTSGTMQQLELRPSGDGGVDAVPVRSFDVGGAIAGAVADDQQGFLFVAQQNQGIWRYSAEPDAGTARTGVATATSPLTAPLGGLGLYALPNAKGYLLAASAGGDQVLVYDRQPPHANVGFFAVVRDGGIDEVTGPTTVEATALPLGPNFPAGLVAVHDAINEPMQNDKLVSWANLANAFTPSLQTSQLDGGTDGGTTDGGRDGGTDGGTGTGTLPGSGQTFPPSDTGGSCGCATASVPGTLLFVVVGLALRSRRRQA